MHKQLLKIYKEGRSEMSTLPYA